MIRFLHKEEAGSGQFEIYEHDSLAGLITYRWAGMSTIIIEHTETKKEFGGKGYGKQLVYKVVDYAKENNVLIIPMCSFAKKVMEEDTSLMKYIKPRF